MNLEKELIRLGYQNPTLRKHLKPVLDQITGRGRKAALRKEAQRIEQTLGGTSIFGLNELVAEIIDNILQKNEINPYLTTLKFNPRENKISISCTYKQHVLGSKGVNAVAEDIKSRIMQLGWRDVDGFGYHSEASNTAEIRITQKNR